MRLYTVKTGEPGKVRGVQALHSSPIVQSADRRFAKMLSFFSGRFIVSSEKKYSLGKNTPELKSNSRQFFRKSFFLIRHINSLHANLSYNFFTKVTLLLHCLNLVSTKFQTDSLPDTFIGAV